jgi:hypothetical protein
MIGDEVRNLFTSNQFDGKSLVSNLGGAILEQVSEKVDDELHCALHQ